MKYFGLFIGMEYLGNGGGFLTKRATKRESES